MLTVPRRGDYSPVPTIHSFDKHIVTCQGTAYWPDMSSALQGRHPCFLALGLPASTSRHSLFSAALPLLQTDRQTMSSSLSIYGHLFHSES